MVQCTKVPIFEKTRIARSALLVLIAALFLAACGKDRKPDLKPEPGPDGPDTPAADIHAIPEAANSFLRWLDTAAVRSVQPEFLTAIQYDEFATIEMLFPDSVEISAPVLDQRKGEPYCVYALRLDDTLSYPSGVAYIVMHYAGQEIESLEVLTLPEPYDLIDLLADGYKELRKIANAKTGTSMTIEGLSYAKLNPVMFPVLHAVKSPLQPHFSDEGILRTQQALGIVEKNGNLWIRKGEALSALDWDLAEIADIIPKAGQVDCMVELDGETTHASVAVSFMVTQDGWRIGSDIKTTVTNKQPAPEKPGAGV